MKLTLTFHGLYMFVANGRTAQLAGPATVLLPDTSRRRRHRDPHNVGKAHQPAIVRLDTQQVWALKGERIEISGSAEGSSTADLPSGTTPGLASLVDLNESTLCLEPCADSLPGKNCAGQQNHSNEPLGATAGTLVLQGGTFGTIDDAGRDWHVPATLRESKAPHGFQRVATTTVWVQRFTGPVTVRFGNQTLSLAGDQDVTLAITNACCPPLQATTRDGCPRESGDQVTDHDFRWYYTLLRSKKGELEARLKQGDLPVPIANTRREKGGLGVDTPTCLGCIITEDGPVCPD